MDLMLMDSLSEAKEKAISMGEPLCVQVGESRYRILSNGETFAMEETSLSCSLAQSGMLTSEARMLAVPDLLEFSDDPALDRQTQKWVFQALRDITGQVLPNESEAWRDWWWRQG